MLVDPCCIDVATALPISKQVICNDEASGRPVRCPMLLVMQLGGIDHETVVGRGPAMAKNKDIAECTLQPIHLGPVLRTHMRQESGKSESPPRIKTTCTLQLLPIQLWSLIRPCGPIVLAPENVQTVKYNEFLAVSQFDKRFVIGI